MPKFVVKKGANLSRWFSSANFQMSCLPADTCQGLKWRSNPLGQKQQQNAAHNRFFFIILVRRLLRHLRVHTTRAMESMFDAYYAQEGSVLELNDIPAVDEPIWILGTKYNALTDINQIRSDIYSKIWITYRRGFVPIGDCESLTTDKGWGCMLRCGQMVLAQALVNLHLGRDWRWEPETKDSTYLEIVRKFEDRRQAPFSIHQIAQMGVSEGKTIGEWFGPNTVAQVLKKLVKYDEWSLLVIHVALDNVVVINEIRELCLDRSKNELLNPWKPLFLVVPLRLGLSEINPIYVKGIQNSFKLRQSIGIIGGKPNLALYFIGCIGTEVICLDPHTTQKAGSVGKKESEEQNEMDLTYHCRRSVRMNILTMDPSIAMCFFCKTEADFTELCQSAKEDIVTSDNGSPLFEICLDRPREYYSDIAAMEVLGASAAYHSSNVDSDEFEIV